MNGICFRSYLNIGIETAISRTYDGGATRKILNVTGTMYARHITYVPGTTSTFVGSLAATGANGISYSTVGGSTGLPSLKAMISWLQNGWPIERAGQALPIVGTEVSFDLSDYDGQTVYVAIKCVSADAFIFMIDDVSLDFTVGVPDIAQDTEISIYPNPVINQMNITSGVEMTQVEIFNQLGQKVFSQVVKNTSFNLNTIEFNKGVYFVKITSDEGVTTKKVMIK